MRIEDTMSPVLRLEPQVEIGRIKALNGGCLAPPLRGAARNNISDAFKALNMPMTRLHDAPLENAGYRLVDVNMVFPLWHLDTDDPRNYYFKDTDKYIANCIGLGTSVNYRLGTSIESPMDYDYMYARQPEDQDKWIDVCKHIIAHYTEGWGNGYRYDMKYWTIYCEPDLSMGWLPPATHDDFIQFYIKAASSLKARFPHLKFGGPGHARLDMDPDGKNARFLKQCAAAKAPLDFYSWHSYAMDIDYMRCQVEAARKMVTEMGYPDAELQLGEWHYIPSPFSTCPPSRQEFYFNHTIKHLDAAAFITGVLTVLQDSPLDMAQYYTATATNFGLFTTRRELTKSYHAMKAFGEIIRYPKRLKIDAPEGVYALAGRNEQGEIAVLLTILHMPGGDVTINIPAQVANVRAWSIDEDNDLDEAAPVECTPGKLKCKVNSKPSVILLKIQTV